MHVAIGADHQGFELKQKLKKQFPDFLERPIDWIDVGAEKLDPQDDYPDYAQKLVQKLLSDQSISKGILICGSGVGVDVMANRHPGIRCGLGLNPQQISLARRDDNINVLALAAAFTATQQALEIVKSFLNTEFSKLPRHQRRLDKIKSYGTR